MRYLTHTLAAAALAVATVAAPVQAGEMDQSTIFTKMADKDGMLSKKDAMKMVEKMFDQADTKKTGKLDKKQVEIFLKSLMESSGG